MKAYFKIITLLLLAIPFIFQSCDTNAPCKLTEDDKAWLLEGYDSLYYLLNNTDTIVALVRTEIYQNEYDYQWGIRSGDNNYYGVTVLDFILNNSIAFRFKVQSKACDETLTIISIAGEYLNDEFENANTEWYYTSKEMSSDSSNYTLLKKSYTNWVKFESDQDTLLNYFIYAKSAGFIEFTTKQKDTIKILPSNFEE